MELEDPIRDLTERIAEAARRAGEHAQRDDWSAALTALGQAERLTDEAIHLAAQQARARGWSWNRIGPAIGVTQQAAWRRFTNPRRQRSPTEAQGENG